MPIFILQAGKRMMFPYNYEVQKIRLELEAQYPVDIFLVGQQDADKVNTKEDAIKYGGIVFKNTSSLDQQIVSLPFIWAQQGGWRLMIGNPTAFDMAVFFRVYKVT